MKLLPETNQAILPVKNKLHIAFLKDTFGISSDNVLKLSRRHFAGRFIHALRCYSTTPVQQYVPPCYETITVEFPKEELSTAENKFCFFRAEHITQINDYLQASFDLYFHWYFYDTRDLDTFEWGQLGMTEVSKMFLVESFIFGLDTINIDTVHETIKKREYRKEVTIINRERQRFLKKDLRFRKRIYEKRRENLKNLMKYEEKK